MDGTGTVQAPRSRRQVRPTELATLAGLTFLLVTAALPTAAEERVGLLVTCALVIAYTAVWYHVLPPDAFGEARSAVGGSAVQLIGVYMLASTGGVSSPWFAFYLLPSLATVPTYRPRSTAVVAVVSAIGLIGVALAAPLPAGPDETRDALIVRLLALGAVASMAYMITQAMWTHRRGLEHQEGRLREALAATEREAMTDPLTGVHNRRSLDHVLSAVTSRAERDARPYSLLLVDVDGLKALNDRAGHVAGDTILRIVGRAATDVVRSYDVVARFGGDEFVVVLHDTTNESAHRTAERVQQRFRELLVAQPEIGSTTISIGAATWQHGSTPGELVAVADEEMYAAKRARGRAHDTGRRRTALGGATPQG